MRKLVTGGVVVVVTILLAGTAVAMGAPVLSGVGKSAPDREAPRVQQEPDAPRPRADARDGAGADEARPDTFGRQRSHEARRFGHCMRDTDGDLSACRDLKPGPAWTTPGHPGQGVRE